MANDESALIVDNGSYCLRAGYSGDYARFVIPTVTVPSEKSSGQLFGNDALYSRSNLCRPIQKRKIVNMEQMEKFWNYLFQSEFQLPSFMDRLILLTEPSLQETKVREEIAEIMFEKFGFGGIYLANQAHLALYETGRTYGTVIDMGEEVIHVVPIYEGQVYVDGVKTMELGGKHVSNHLKQLLESRKLPFTLNDDIINDIKEKTSYVALDYAAAMKLPMESVSVEYELPDGNTLTIGHERFQCTEVLFKPSLIGLKGADGVHDMASKCLKELLNTSAMFNNIVIAGGSSMPAGTAERFQQTFKKLYKKEATKVVAPENRNSTVYDGASILTSIPSFQTMWVTHDDYLEVGAEVVVRRCIH